MGNLFEFYITESYSDYVELSNTLEQRVEQTAEEFNNNRTKRYEKEEFLQLFEDIILAGVASFDVDW